MPTINELTEQQFKNLLDEYFAPPEKRSKMTEEEIKDFATRLNRKINVPLIRETGEQKILLKIVIKIDRFLYDNLPNEFYDLIRSADKGIDDEEAKRLIKRLTKLANDKIDIPYIPEVMEGIAIKFVIGLIINAARRQWGLSRVEEIASNMIVPSTDDFSDEGLATLMV